MSLKACIFDLDGVITDTEKYQFESWKWVADQIGFTLSPKQNTKLKQGDRRDSIDKLIKWANVRISEAEKQQLMLEKNNLYLNYIDNMRPEEVFKGFRNVNSQLRTKGLKVAVGSSSKNTIRIIDKLDLVLDFDAIIDGNMLDSKDAIAEVYLLACEKMQIAPEECVVFEDSQEGIDAAMKAGMKVVAFGKDRNLKNTSIRIEDWESVNIDELLELIS
jgi:beta-phosphoglucomutase